MKIILNAGLNLEGTRLPAATGTLELAAGRQDTRSLVLVGAETEVTDGLTSIAGTTEEEGVAASRSTASKLVDGDGLTTSLHDTGTGTLGETESGNGDLLRGLEETVVVGDGTDNNDGLASGARTGNGARDASNRDRGAVGLRKEKLPQDDLVELGIRTAGQEAVKLHKQTQVRVLRSRLLAVATASVGLAEVVNSHCTCAKVESDLTGDVFHFLNIGVRKSITVYCSVS